jgi:epoxide hydrolase 4
VPPSLQRIDTGEITLHVAIEGEGPPLYLLHGFPEHWRAWQEQMGPLAAAGFRVIAPDLRGYNLSDKPAGTERYRMSHVVNDVVGLARALGHDRIHLAGHDWGGVVGWITASTHPALIERLVILNAPHPERYQQELRHLRQLARAWYVFYYQLPFFPERSLKSAKGLERMLRGTALTDDAFPDELLAHHLDAVRVPGAARAMIDWYRASVRWPPRAPDVIQAPTLLLWGDRDHALVPELTRGLEPYVPHLSIQRFDASHWVHHDRPREVTKAMIDFLRAE